MRNFSQNVPVYRSPFGSCWNSAISSFVGVMQCDPACYLDRLADVHNGGMIITSPSSSGLVFFVIVVAATTTQGFFTVSRISFFLFQLDSTILCSTESRYRRHCRCRETFLMIFFSLFLVVLLSTRHTYSLLISYFFIIAKLLFLVLFITD